MRVVLSQKYSITYPVITVVAPKLVDTFSSDYRTEKPGPAL